MKKDTIDRIIDTVLEHTVVEGMCSHCSDNSDAHAIVDDFKSPHRPMTDYQECRNALRKLLLKALCTD